MNSLFSSVRVFGATPTAGIIRDPLGIIGVPVGDSKDVAPFHSSAFALSLAPHLPESIQGIPEKGVLSFAGSVPQNGKWYEAFITHPHDPAFWSELEQLLHSLAPGEKYCILIQPQLSHGSHVTLDGSFLTDSNPNMQVLQDHFKPLIAKLEDDYNDEFCGQTRIKIRNSEGPHPTSSTPSSPKTPKVTQTSQILQAILESNKASQVQTSAILEAIKTQAQPDPSPLSGVNWTPLIQGVATGLAQAFGAQVSFPSPTPTTPSTPASISTDPTILTRLEKIDQELARQSKTLENLSQGFNNLTSTVNTLSSIVAQLAQSQGSKNS